MDRDSEDVLTSRSFKITLGALYLTLIIITILLDVNLLMILYRRRKQLQDTELGATSLYLKVIFFCTFRVILAALHLIEMQAQLAKNTQEILDSLCKHFYYEPGSAHRVKSFIDPLCVFLISIKGVWNFIPISGHDKLIDIILSLGLQERRQMSALDDRAVVYKLLTQEVGWQIDRVCDQGQRCSCDLFSKVDRKGRVIEIITEAGSAVKFSAGKDLFFLNSISYIYGDIKGFVNPEENGGRMVTFGFQTFPDGLGEPLNVIISGNSDPDVLIDQNTNGGLRNYYLSLKFGTECLGQHIGSNQMADLGDGNGPRNDTAVMRYDFGNSAIGTCEETFEGGNHLRYWTQNGSKANTSAVFLATSVEKPASDNHDIVFDGYDLGRDWLVGNITGKPISSVSNTSVFDGTTSFGGFSYSTKVEYMSGLLNKTSTGINHFLTVGGGPNNITAIDGLVAVLTVKITGRPKASSS
ncbi:hypothetical protein Clacol_010058 [Clathrus columnatus]|uniref:Uncharacterized protein n=1 Tax=Clathrus columnatus TaxID=1419009 RepID=A0AAV5AMW8_9AGAM|nr:hypothetical protein Clacol_010058 [Clathrus columnatus]